MSHSANPSRLPWLGFAFVILLIVSVVMSVMAYAGAFRSTRDVSMYAAEGGNQLTVGAQVKLHGMVVGTVKNLSASGTQAKLTLALDPDYVHLIPKNVQARILPKTLIGQDYIDLVMPSQPESTPIAAGDVISQDRTSTAVELETALNDLLDTLHVLPPQELAVTLNALSSSLNGRGEELGKTLDDFGRYLKGLNPQLPTLVADMKALAKTSKTYDQAAPELLGALKNFTTTAQTLVAQRASLDALYKQVTGAADTTTAFLRANGNNIISLVAESRDTLQLLAQYAPEYPCLLDQLAGLVPRVDQAFGKGTARPALNVKLAVTPMRGKYLPNETPQYLDKRGPRCYPIVRLAPQYPDGIPLKDGSRAPVSTPQAMGTASAQQSLASIPNSKAENSLISELFGKKGKAAPSFSSLLLGPLLRGSQVSVR